MMSEGELFIVGRIKDLLIVDGRNHYPDDIEATIQEITGGRVAAISIPDERTEQLVAIIELKKRGNSQQDVHPPAEHGQTRSDVGDFAVTQRPHLRPGAGATRIHPHHDERQGAARGLRGTLPAR